MTKNTTGSGFKERFLIQAQADGVLNGLTFTIKDIFNVKDHRTGFGNPLWENTHPKAVEHAICIQQLLMNGASCLGNTITGELGCGSSGANHFYGTPINPKAPDLMPGGSSCGSATTVAEKLVDFSLGSDAGGSIRVPASFCGIFGMRPSQGIISTAGMIQLSPSLETVGVFSNSIEIIQKAMSVLQGPTLDTKEDDVGDIFIIEDLVNICSAEIKHTINEFCDLYYKTYYKKPIIIKLNDIDNSADHSGLGIANTFLYILCGEIWTSISSWSTDIELEYQKNTYVDFTFMKNLDKKKLTIALTRMQFYFDKINKLLSTNNLICIPTTPFTAIPRVKNKTKVNNFDYNRLRPLVSLSSIGKVPQINVPIPQSSPPIGISFIAGFRRDNFLINSVKKLCNEVYKLGDHLNGV